MFKLYLAFCVILNINYFFVWFKKIYNLSCPLLDQSCIRHRILPSFPGFHLQLPHVRIRIVHSYTQTISDMQLRCCDTRLTTPAFTVTSYPARLFSSPSSRKQLLTVSAYKTASVTSYLEIKYTILE
jgi:hypothetical protein